MSIYIYPYVYMYKYIDIYVYVNIDLFISVLTMVYLLFYLFIDLQVLSIYLSIQLSIYLSIYLFQSDLTYSSSSSLSICLLSIDYAFIYWEGSPPLFKHFGCILRIRSQKNGGISTEIRYFHGGVLEPPAGILHNSQSLPIGWYLSVTRQFQIPSNKGFLFQQKYFNWKKKQSTCFLHVPIN